MDALERLTGSAKKALAFAQKTAQDAGADIEPEHLLLGVVHEQAGLGARVLQRLGVSPGELERRVAARPQALAKGSPGAPAAGVGRVIQLAFEEAVLMRHREVGTEHLLLGVLSEGTSRAATGLVALGVSLERVRQMIRALRALPAAAAPITAQRPGQAPEIDMPNAQDVDAALYEAMRRARQESALNVRLDHLLLAIFSQPDGRALLRSLGIDAAALRRLAPPQSVVDAQRRVRELQVMDELLAARARTAAEQALSDWVKTWSVPPAPPAPPESPIQTT